MSDFETFYKELVSFVQKYEKNTFLKTERDPDSDIVKIFGERISALSKAKNGLNDVTELAYTTAEHHPYWNVLYNASEIIHSVLEKWDDKLTTADMDDIKWAIKEINQTMAKIQKNN